PLGPGADRADGEGLSDRRLVRPDARQHGARVPRLQGPTAGLTAAGEDLGKERDDVVLHRGGHLDAALVHVHVDLAADPEVFEIDTRLDREAGPRNELALVDRLETVDVAAVSVHLEPDTVAGAVDEMIGVPALADVVSR